MLIEFEIYCLPNNTAVKYGIMRVFNNLGKTLVRDLDIKICNYM